MAKFTAGMIGSRQAYAYPSTHRNVEVADRNDRFGLAKPPGRTTDLGALRHGWCWPKAAGLLCSDQSRKTDLH
jgi:hypothetical protein